MYTFCMMKDAQNIILDMLKLALLWYPYTFSFIRRRFENKFYRIYLRLAKLQIVSVTSSRKLYLCKLKDFRNPQYPIKNKSL